MKRFRIVTLITLMALLFGLTGVVYAEKGPESVNTFTVSPDPQTAGSNVTLSINVDIADGDSNDITYLCIYEPDTNAGVDEPNSFVLTYYSGFTTQNVTFTETTQGGGEPTCPTRSGQTSTLYKASTSGSPALPDTSTTYDGSVSWSLDVNATAGSYDWTLLLSEPGGTPNPLSYNHEIQPAPTKIYASDQSDCGGYGIAGTSCFQSLQDAINATTATADEVVIVGTLTADTTGSTVGGSSVAVIRGIQSPHLAAPGGCTNATLLSLNKATVTVRDFTIDGSSCSGTATGIDVSATGAVIENMTVQSFSAGTGIRFSSGGAGTVRNCTSSIDNNNVGINIQSGAGVVSVGTDPSDGNVLSGNTTGILVNDTDAVIKGNTISGGTNGIELQATPSAIYGNSVTGASSNQIYCNGSTTGAAFNYLGGVSISSGSNCTDVASQIGAQIAGWADGASYGDISVSGSSGSVAVFQLTDDPYTFGSGDGDLTAFYAVRDTGGNGTVSHAGSGIQAKMLMDASGCSPMTTTCWESATDGRSQTGSGYYAVGNTDPTAVTFTAVSASSNTWLPVALVVTFSMLALGTLVVLRKRA